MKKKKSTAVIFAFLLVHTVSLVGLYPFYTLEGLILCAVLTINFGMAITIVYHRYLTHGGFKTSRPMHYILSLWGLIAGEGPPIVWVANHRKHHEFSDDGSGNDPHSPKDRNLWFSHIGWMMAHESSEELTILYNKYAPDLQRYRFMRMLNRTYIYWHIAFGLFLFFAGYAYSDSFMGMSFLIYGLFVRMMLVWHITWMVNSVSHVWGYRTYDTSDDSKNNWIVALLAQGEGWHNNHHAFPTCVRAGHKWWEIDTSYWVIWTLKKVHLIWNVKDKISSKGC